MFLLSLRRVLWVAGKEVLHIVRDRAMLLFTLVSPVMQMIMIGYGVDTNIRHTSTVVLDQSRTQQSRALVRRFHNSDSFTIVGEVLTDEELGQALVSGRARVGLKIPENYARRLKQGQTAQVLILVDGSNSGVAADAVTVGNAVVLRESLDRGLEGRAIPVEARPQVLFNPDTRAANYLLPSLLIILTQTMSVVLTANSIVREKEKGTLEQLFLTPVRRSELLAGKLLPYLGLTLLEFCGIVVLMWCIFTVPVKGAFITLLLLQVPFTLSTLGLGLWISSRSNTRDTAMQLTFMTVLPAVFLSGYLFPVESMPGVFRYIAHCIPTTWMIDAARAVIIRGAGWEVLYVHALVLLGMAGLMLWFSSGKFRRELG
jgi:ABC-2 type transport system permease protein